MNNYTIDEVEKHNLIDDAWVIIDKNVYDITYFLNIHPGGNILFQFAGKDITDYFYELHQLSVLTDTAEQYKIGTLI
jgi:cytochrome b involved in lipid metabolism